MSTAQIIAVNVPLMGHLEYSHTYMSSRLRYVTRKKEAFDEGHLVRLAIAFKIERWGGLNQVKYAVAFQSPDDSFDWETGKGIVAERIEATPGEFFLRTDNATLDQVVNTIMAAVNSAVEDKCMFIPGLPHSWTRCR